MASNQNFPRRRRVALSRVVGWQSLACVFALLTGTACAEFDNTDGRNNGDDLRALRRAVAGWDEGAGDLFATPVPPTEEDGASSLHGEARAQTILMRDGCLILCFLAGMVGAHVTFSRVRLGA